MLISDTMVMTAPNSAGDNPRIRMTIARKAKDLVRIFPAVTRIVDRYGLLIQMDVPDYVALYQTQADSRFTFSGSHRAFFLFATRPQRLQKYFAFSINSRN